MPYKQRLDRELEPELFLVGNIFGEIPGFGFEFEYPFYATLSSNRLTLLKNVRKFYDLLSPETLTYLKSSEILDRVAKTLSTLSEREQKILQIVHGFQDGAVYTYQEATEFIPRVMNSIWRGKGYPAGEPVTRERIRQIESKALRRLRHPSRSRELRQYLTLLAENRPEYP